MGFACGRTKWDPQDYSFRRGGFLCCFSEGVWEGLIENFLLSSLWLLFPWKVTDGHCDVNVIPISTEEEKGPAWSKLPGQFILSYFLTSIGNDIYSKIFFLLTAGPLKGYLCCLSCHSSDKCGYISICTCIHARRDSPSLRLIVLASVLVFPLLSAAWGAPRH